MSMDKINGSPLMHPGLLDRFKVDNKETEGSEKPSTLNSGDRPAQSPADRAEISDTAHQLVDLRAAVDVGRISLEAIPDVREDKVAEAKKRLEQGYYNSQVVKDEVAGTLPRFWGRLTRFKN